MGIIQMLIPIVGADGYIISRALRFNSQDTSHLSRTPATASNRKTFTFSTWLKRSKLGVRQFIFEAGSADTATDRFMIRFQDNDTLMVTVGQATNRQTSQVFRDPGAWANLIVAVDTTASTANDRIKIYWNGSQITDFSSTSNPSQNANTGVNSAAAHSIGKTHIDNSHYYDGELADIQFVDGQALAASEFGKYNDQDVWIPKKFNGTYGSLGYRLAFDEVDRKQKIGYDSKQNVELDPKGGMDVALYTGNGASTPGGSGNTQNIGGLNFEPGLLWIKDRTQSGHNHNLFDVINRPPNLLMSDETNALVTNSTDGVRNFNPDGFFLGANSSGTQSLEMNKSGNNYVAWTWRAGGTAVANTSGTITSQVSANTDYGFSVVKWTATNGYGTIGHGLTNQTPKFILVKSLASANWAVFHTSLGNTKGLNLNLNGTGTTAQEMWNNTSPTTSVFSVGAFTNYQTAGHIAYVWSEVSGYSKFGTYEGASTVTVTTGFKPRWILLKNVDASGSWSIFDSERDSDLEINHRIYANENGAEGTNIVIGNFTDTGFTLTNQGNSNWNTTGDTFVYAAFADRPGNNWDVNNLVTNEGLSASKAQFDVVTYSGNGGAQAIGQPVYSDQTTGGNNTSNMFDGSSSSWNNLTAGNTITFTPSPAIACTQLDIWVDTDTPIRVNVNGGGYGSTFTQSGLGYVNITPGGGMTSLTSLLIDAPSGGGGSGAGIRGLRINGTTIVVNGDGGQGLDFQPDFLWIKSRSSGTEGHYLANSVSGLTKNVRSDSSSAEQTNTNGVTAATANGFTLGDSGRVNGSSQTYVAWCWKAGGTAVSNSDGSITSSVSANAAYGFSVVTYTGTGSAATVGHGLSGKVPELIIVKNRDRNYNWAVWSSQLSSNAHYLFLNNTDGQSSNYYTYWNNTAPTGSVFSVGADNSGTAANVNQNGDDMVAYCFANVPGYQRVGSYIGNGSSTGPMVITGFKPRFILIRSTSSNRGWLIYDTERDKASSNDNNLFPHTSGAENSDVSHKFNILDNGFLPKTSSANRNANGETYIYLAIADDEIGINEAVLVDVCSEVSDDADATDTTGGYERGNYATLNPLLDPDGQNVTLSHGNLKFVSGAASGNYVTRFATIGMTTGKWYAEFKVNATANGVFIGIAADPNSVSNFIGSTASSAGYLNDGRKANSNSLPSYANSYGADDVISIAFDADAGSLVFYQNGVSQGEAYSGLNSGPYFMGISGTTNVNVECNFGQQRFRYGLPSGYATLNTTSLPAATIEDGSTNFDAVLYTGNGGTQTISGLSFNPDLVWIKNRGSVENHSLNDSVRGVNKQLQSSTNTAESTHTNQLTSFNADGFTVGSSSQVNENNVGQVAWCWNAGENSNKTYTVKVVSDSGNKYRFDDHGTSAVTLDLAEGSTYVFDQSDSSNAGHPLRFSTTANGTHGGGSEYTTGVTVTGTPGQAGAKTTIVVAASAPLLFYYCTQHSGMGGQINTNSTAGSTRLSGSENSVVYNQSQNYTNNVSSTSNITSGHEARLFNGILSGTNADIQSSQGTVGVINFSSAITGSKIEIYTVGNIGQIGINGSNVSVTANQFVDTGVTSLTSVETRHPSAGLVQNPTALRVDGKILVDSNVTPPTVPTSNSVVKANPEAGFSIIGYTGTGSALSIAHGLNATPTMFIQKNRSSSEIWRVYYTVVDGSLDFLRLNTTGSKSDSSNSLPTSSVIHISGTSGDDYIVYAFAPVAGYSAFGSYTGNGSNDGPFVHTGFRPRWLMIKRTDSTSNWVIIDAARSSFNEVNDLLYAEQTLAETVNDVNNGIDFLSNGFKLRKGVGGTNVNGATLIYIAFASNPFQANNGIAR